MENDDFTNYTDKDTIYYNVLYNDLCSLFDTIDHINDNEIKQDISCKKEMKKDHCLYESLYYETLYNDLCDLFEKIDEEQLDGRSFEQKEPHKKDMGEFVPKEEIHCADDENEHYYEILYSDLCDMFDKIDKQSEDLAFIPEEPCINERSDSRSSIPDWGNIEDIFTNEDIEIINKYLAKINYEFCTSGHVNINESIKNCIKRYNVNNFDLIDFLMNSGDEIVLEFSSGSLEKNLNDINENIFPSQSSPCDSHANIIHDFTNNSSQPLFIIDEHLWTMLSCPDYTERISSFLSDNPHNITNNNNSPVFIMNELLHTMLAHSNDSEYIPSFLSDIYRHDIEFLISNEIFHQKEPYITAALDSTGITCSDSTKVNTPIISIDDDHQENSSILVEKRITEGINFLHSMFMRNTSQDSSHLSFSLPTIPRILPSQTKNRWKSSTCYSNRFPRDDLWKRYCEISAHTWDDTLTSNDTSFSTGLSSARCLKFSGDKRELPDRSSHFVMFVSKLFI